MELAIYIVHKDGEPWRGAGKCNHIRVFQRESKAWAAVKCCDKENLHQYKVVRYTPQLGEREENQ